MRYFPVFFTKRMGSHIRFLLLQFLKDSPRFLQLGQRLVRPDPMDAYQGSALLISIVPVNSKGRYCSVDLRVFFSVCSRALLSIITRSGKAFNIIPSIPQWLWSTFFLSSVCGNTHFKHISFISRAFEERFSPAITVWSSSSISSLVSLLSRASEVPKIE